MTEPKQIHAQLIARGCTAELWLNGAPLSRIDSSPGRMPIESVAVDHWIVSGENVLELVVSPGETPTSGRGSARADEGDAAELPLGASAAARLIRFTIGPPDVDPPPGELLAEATVAAPLARVSLAGAGPWRFETAQILVPGGALDAEVEAVLREIEAAYATRDVTRLHRVFELHYAEVARAFPAYTDAAILAELQGAIDLYGRADPPVLRDAAARDHRIVAGGRLIECIDRDWTASLKLHDPDTHGAVPLVLFLGRPVEGGALRVLR